MSKTRKILATLTMVAVTATASLTAVSSAQAHVAPWLPAHLHVVPGPFIPPGPLLPFPPVHNHASHHHHSSHNHGLNSGQAAALGLLGGIIIGTIVNAKKQPVQPAGLPAAHYAYCDARYRSYVIVSNTFTGYDGNQHYCVSPYI